MAIKILFLKNSTNIKSDFCKTYILSIQHKVYSKKSFINTTDKPRICLYIDLFCEKNILLSIKNY